MTKHLDQFNKFRQSDARNLGEAMVIHAMWYLMADYPKLDINIRDAWNILNICLFLIRNRKSM